MTIHRHVPPGHGKFVTHSRNLRRRKKKLYDRLALPTQAESSNPNDIPIPTQRPVEPRLVSVGGPAAVRNTESTPVMMASLSNKNKRRGFKQAMASARPPKIIFAQDGIEEEATGIAVPEVPPLTFASTADSSILTAATSTTFPRLIPPSQKKLPSNVFVTSIDVEDRTRFETKVESNYVGLDKVEDQPANSAALIYDSVPPENAVDFNEIQRKWDTLQPLKGPQQVPAGMLIAWKVRPLQHHSHYTQSDHSSLQSQALGLNPATYTPEIMLHVGRVLSSDMEKLVIERVPDPSVEISSAFGENEIEDEEEHPWPTLLDLGWRILAT